MKRCQLFSAVTTVAVALLMPLGLTHAAEVGSTTITDADHYGYFGFSSTSALNAKATVGPFAGTADGSSTGRARVVRVTGTLTGVSAEAWASSLRVHPSGGGLADYQPGFQFTRQRDFSGTIAVEATLYAPGGVDLSTAMTFEMYSIDSEGFVPGLDGRSTLTYTFDDAYPAGAVEYSGTLGRGDAVFNRPVQVETSSGYSEPFLSNRMPYHDVQPFFVDTAGDYALATANEFESAAVLYEGAFDPSDPLSGIVLALGQTRNVLRHDGFNDLPFADDATGGTLIEAELQPGVQYYFVTTTFAGVGGADDGGPFFGQYTNLIAGSGQVTLGVVPEPGTAMLVFGSAGVACWRRRR